MMSQVTENANHVSDFIKSSTHYSMLLNRKEDVYESSGRLAANQISAVFRILTSEERSLSPQRTLRQGSVVDLKAEACFGCHDQERPLDSAPPEPVANLHRSDGRRILGLINPIRNETQCSSAGCHSHPTERTVLGVLDVRMSLEKVDDAITGSQQRIIGVAIILLVVVASTSWYFLSTTVLRPGADAHGGNARGFVREPRLEIPVLRKDEIGQLASSFNAMTQSLQRAEKENREWSLTLEQRVRDKTSELEHVHQRVMQIEKMASLGKLAATVAHELNNPLEGILTYAN